MAWSSLDGAKKSKFNAQRTIMDGEKFDSRKEADRWRELRTMEIVGVIKNLRRQVKYELIPAQVKPSGGKERPVNYFADFVYEQNGRTVVEDVKGMRTPEYKMKRKFLLWKFGIEIHEV